MKSKLPNFKGKMLSILSENEDTPSLLGDIRFEMQAGRLFVVGIIPKGGSTGDWVVGLSCAIAWDTVQEYIVFDSAADYAKRVAIYDRKATLHEPKKRRKS